MLEYHKVPPPPKKKFCNMPEILIASSEFWPRFGTASPALLLESSIVIQLEPEVPHSQVRRKQLSVGCRILKNTKKAATMVGDQSSA
jgi:hypothetical protein